MMANKMSLSRKSINEPGIKGLNGSFFLFILLTIIISSCGNPGVLDKYQRIPGAGWKKEEPVVIEGNLPDKNALYNIYLQVRNTTDYNYSNLYLFISTTLPDNTETRDTVECYLASPDGKWIGSGFGKIKESRWLMKKGMMISKPGLYKFSIEQAMRVDILEGISDIGLKIEKQ